MEQELPKGSLGRKLLKIDPDTKDFTANGNRYLVENEISFDRWNKYQKLQIELGYSISFPDLFNKLQEVYNLCNSLKFADAVVLVRDIMKGVIDVQKEQDPAALRLCALFINREDEDRRTINEDVIAQKLEDWRKEGIDVGSFFQLALHIIPGFQETYKVISQDTSK